MNKLKTDNPFAVPENYFSSLESKVMERIRSEEHSSGRVSGQVFRPEYSRVFRLAVIIVAAAAVLLLGAFGLVRLWDYNGSMPSDSESDLITQLLEEGWLDSHFIYAHAGEIDMEAVASLEVINLESIAPDDFDLEQLALSLTDEEIIEYLNIK